MPFIEDFQEFKMRMGCPFLPTRTGYAFENGAFWSDGGEHNDPPTDEPESLWAKLLYLETSLGFERRKFLQCQSYITLQSEFHRHGAGGFVVPKAFDDLKNLKESVRVIEAKIAAMRSRISELRGETSWDKYQQRRFDEKQKSFEDVSRMYDVLNDKNLELVKV